MRIAWYTWIAVAGVLLSTGALLADELHDFSPSSGEPVTPEQDDAALHDVQFVTSQTGWAVGDRGVVWKTSDGGRTWRLQPTPVDCSLRSVCFVNERLGWVVGGGVTSQTQSEYGVVLKTDNSGQTWTELSGRSVPMLYRVKFFTGLHGIAVGNASARFSTGCLTTEDGGATWQPISGSASDGWRAGDFLNPTTGYVGGLRGEHAPFGTKLLPRTTSTFGLRGVNAIQLQSTGRGWLVGDGGLAMSTDAAGAVWDSNVGLAAAVRETFDFRAVATNGSHVWIAGTPGGVIWHSSGQGEWRPQFTRTTAPIHALSFVTDRQGCAVGAFGQILLTVDGGNSWHPIRAGGRRAALLVIQSGLDRTPIRLLTRDSGEQGFRAVVSVTARRDVGPDGYLESDGDGRLHDAVIATGACDTQIGWRLPIAAPGLDRDYQRLVQQWSLLTDNRLPDVMLGGLVRDLRTWRPDVVLIDDPSGDDATAQLIYQAVEQAVKHAADATRFPEQIHLGGLHPWSVARVVTRLPAGQLGDVNLDPNELLPRKQRTLAMAAADPLGRLGLRTTDDREGYRFVSGVAVGSRSLFAGLSLPTGGDARRDTTITTEIDYEALERLAQHQRNFNAYAERAVDDLTQASQLVAQLDDVIGAAPPDQAALQLAALADEYKSRAHWQLAEETLIELVQRYPREPVALESMRWLLTLWTSQEVGWQRLSAMTAGQSNVTFDGHAAQANITRAEQRSAEERLQELVRSPTSPLAIQPVGAQVAVGGKDGQRKLEASRWKEQAVYVAETMSQSAPNFFAEPANQFLYAALLRSRGQYSKSDAIYREFVNDSDPAWQRAARGEAWIMGSPAESPKPVVRCRRAESPPFLDGLLSDLCWQEAREIRLGQPDQAADDDGGRFLGTTSISDGERDRDDIEGEAAIVMLAYDAEYLYVAASIPRNEGLPPDPPQLAGREHDANLAGFDQISLQLDVDRDYATYYRFDVDSRAQTREACWTDQSWDPEWYVAADSDPRRWSIEVAIPINALVPAPPGRGQTWGAGIVRTMPAIGVESWTGDSGAVPRPPVFGLLRFE